MGSCSLLSLLLLLCSCRQYHTQLIYRAEANSSVSGLGPAEVIIYMHTVYDDSETFIQFISLAAEEASDNSVHMLISVSDEMR